MHYKCLPTELAVRKKEASSSSVLKSVEENRFLPTWSPHLGPLRYHQSYSPHIDSVVYLRQRIKTAFSGSNLLKRTVRSWFCFCSSHSDTLTNGSKKLTFSRDIEKTKAFKETTFLPSTREQFMLAEPFCNSRKRKSKIHLINYPHSCSCFRTVVMFQKPPLQWHISKSYQQKAGERQEGSRQ